MKRLSGSRWWLPKAQNKRECDSLYRNKNRTNFDDKEKAARGAAGAAAAAVASSNSSKSLATANRHFDLNSTHSGLLLDALSQLRWKLIGTARQSGAEYDLKLGASRLRNTSAIVSNTTCKKNRPKNKLHLLKPTVGHVKPAYMSLSRDRRK